MVKRIKKNWVGVMSDLNGLANIELAKPDFDAVADALIKSGTHAVIFDLVLTKAEFQLGCHCRQHHLEGGQCEGPFGRRGVPHLPGALNGWSSADRNIVPDADFKKFNDSNRRKPAKPTYKDFDEMAKKSKADVDAFRNWAKGNSNAKKAFEAIDKTAKAKPNDPARLTADGGDPKVEVSRWLARRLEKASNRQTAPT